MYTVTVEESLSMSDGIATAVLLPFVPNLGFGAGLLGMSTLSCGAYSGMVRISNWEMIEIVMLR